MIIRFAPRHFENRSEFSVKIPTLFEIRAFRTGVPVFYCLKKYCDSFFTVPFLSDLIENTERACAPAVSPHAAVANR